MKKNVRKKTKNDWVNKLAVLAAQAFKDFNWGKAYEELREMAESIDLDFASPKFHSNTRFANSCKNVFKSFYTDLPALILSYTKNRDDNLNSNVQRERDLGQHAKDMLKKINNKMFLLSTGGALDIYTIFSIIVCDLQKVNQLPFERYDTFQKLCKTLIKMTETVSDHLLCEDSNCSWPTLHRDRSSIISQKISNEGESVFNSRSVAKLLHSEKHLSFEEKLNTNLKVFTTDLYQELSTIFLAKDKSCIEDSRILSDWNSLAVKLKSRSPAYLFILEKGSYVEASQRMDRNLKSIETTSIEAQFKVFLKRLDIETKLISVEDLESSDPKHIIKTFMKREDLYDGIEIIMQATAVSAIKLSVESIVESFISVYNLHNNKLRPMEEETVDDEMMIHLNGPEIGECDKILKLALDKHFNGKSWHFTTQNNIFKTHGKAVTSVLSKKSKLPFYK